MIIDLSVLLDESTPVYPGDPKLQIEIAATFENSGNLGHCLSMGTHAGTHIDAPAHKIQDGRTLDTFSVDSFTGNGRCIAISDRTFDLETIMKADILEGDIVMFNTGMSRHFHEPAYSEDFPVMSEEIAQYLVKCKVKMVGVDTCSIDNEPNFPIHKILFENDILIIENLTNLERLEGLESVIYALPIRLDLDGAPARVIAEVR